MRVNGSELAWDAEADLESGLASFIIERDGQEIGSVPEQPKNPFGRPIFQRPAIQRHAQSTLGEDDLHRHEGRGGQEMRIV